MWKLKLRSILFSLLGIFCALSLVGVGYTAWYFSKTESNSKDAPTKMIVTKVLGRLGSFDVVAPELVVLDEGTSVASLYTGINFYDQVKVSEVTGKPEYVVGSNFTVSFSPSNELIELVKNQTISSFDERDVGFRIDIEGALGDYITFSPLYQSLQNDEGIVTFARLNAYQSSQSGSGNTGGSADGYSYTINVSDFSMFFQYKSGQKPTDADKYKGVYEDINMKVADSVIVITCIAGI